MIRTARYSTTAAAVLILAAGAWWLLFGHGATNAWAELIDQVAGIQTAVCNLHEHRGGHEEVSETYLAGSRIRVENPNQFHVVDFLEGKSLWAIKLTKTAVIEELEEYRGRLVLGSNPLNDLMQWKSVRAQRLPDERVGDLQCLVYRVEDTAFIGYHVPWVKLWVDPDSKLPVQIHTVFADSRAMTLKDFRWDEAFGEKLLRIAVPEGYELLESPGGQESSKTVEPMRSDDVASDVAGSTEDGPEAKAGREIPTGEIAETLDMLGQRIEANYRAISSWSGTLDVMERYRYTNPNNPQFEQISHSAVEFFAEPGRERIRIDNRAVEPVRIVGNTSAKPVDELPESRWVRTAQELLRFPVSELQHHVEGFPFIVGPEPEVGFRVLYREPPRAGEQFIFQGYIDPLSFFGEGEPNWELCSRWADCLRGEFGRDNMEYVIRNTALRVRQKGLRTEYVLAKRFKPVGSGNILEWVFSSEAGFNVVSSEFRERGQPVEARQSHLRKENGVFIPHKVEFRRYDARSTGETGRSPTQHRVFTLKETQVNEPIDPAVFEIQTLGLREGDRMVDRIENRMEVFDGKQFVSADKFMHLPAVDTQRDDGRRAQSTNNVKQLVLCMHTYHDAHKRFPARAVFDENGQPLLSWRVHILPHLGRGKLYDQFHLDEPWDSPHNRKLIERMPAVFRGAASEAPPNMTAYLVPVGPGTLFEGRKGRSFREITDGTSNTIMLVEVNDDQAVIWTKPDDFEYDRPDPRGDLVGTSPDGFLAGLADGSVRFIRSSLDPTVLRAFFTYAGREKVSAEGLE